MLFQAPPPVAFVDVAVLTMERPGDLEHRKVMVKDGRGQDLLPGFSDLHTIPDGRSILSPI